MTRIPPHGAHARAPVGPHHPSGNQDEERREAGCRQVHDVIEAGGSPAEGLMPRRVMPDHAVGGIDCLVGGHAGQPEQRAPEDRGDHAIREILGEAFDRGPHDAGPRRAAPDCGQTMRETAARPAARPDVSRPTATAGDVVVEAPLRQQAGARDAEHHDAEPAAEPDHRHDLNHEAKTEDEAEDEEQRQPRRAGGDAQARAPDR